MTKSQQRDARAEAEKYCQWNPFTLAGFTQPEVDFIQNAYKRAFEAGAAWGIARGREDALEEVIALIRKGWHWSEQYRDCGEVADWLESELAEDRALKAEMRKEGR